MIKEYIKKHTTDWCTSCGDNPATYDICPNIQELRGENFYCSCCEECRAECKDSV